MAVIMTQPGADERPVLRPADLSTEPPLCVDLDGTLVRSDLLIEMAFAYLRGNLRGVRDLIVWTLRGKARLKTELAKRVPIDAENLPYNPELLTYLRQQHDHGRRIILVTASPQVAVQQIADGLGIFDSVFATDDKQNLASGAKRDRLTKMFGRGGFDYVGNAWADLPVWSAARRAMVADPHFGVLPVARRMANVVAVHYSRPPLWKTVIKAIRVHQWLKNVLVFFPILASHRFVDPALLGQAVIAFFSLSFTASAIYVFNDLLDVRYDRRHPKKRRRPIASGDFPISTAVAIVPVLLLIAAELASLLPFRFMLSVAAYGTVSLLYSWWFKRHELFDVVVLAGLWTLRLIAGGEATGVQISFWLSSFSMFLFMSLALAKRCSELVTVRGESGQRAHGRDYRVDDLAVLAAMGGGAGCTAVLVLALYVYHPQAGSLYHNADRLLMLCPLLLYWIGRIWLKTWRGEMSEDPVIFALSDRASRWVFAGAALIFLFAI